MTSSGRYVSPLPDHVVTITRFYCPHGPVRVHVQSNKAQTKIPTVRQLVASMTKKYEQQPCRERRRSGAFLGARIKTTKSSSRRAYSGLSVKRRGNNHPPERQTKSAGDSRNKLPEIHIDPPSEDETVVSTCDEDHRFLLPRRVRCSERIVESYPPRNHEVDEYQCQNVSQVLRNRAVSETHLLNSDSIQVLSDCEGQCSAPYIANASIQNSDEEDSGDKNENRDHDKIEKGTRRHSVVNVGETSLIEETKAFLSSIRISSSNSIRRTSVRRYNATAVLNSRNDTGVRTVRLPTNIRVGIFCQKHGELSRDRLNASSTASTAIQSYQPSDYVSFTASSDLTQRAPSNGLSDEPQHRSSASDQGCDCGFQDRKRAVPVRTNSLQTQLRALKQEKVSKLNTLESSFREPSDRDGGLIRDKDCQALNDRVQERERAQFRQNYFKPLGARNTNYSVSNNPVVLHPRGQAPNGRDSDENMVAMGTFVGSSNMGTSPALKSFRSSSSGTGGAVQPAGNAQQMHLNQNTTTVGLNVRKFNSRLNQSNISPYNCGQNQTPPKPKDDDSRYPDPMLGAPASFQQRIAELASLEADTIRHERAKKLKKRSKDS